MLETASVLDFHGRDALLGCRPCWMRDAPLPGAAMPGCRPHPGEGSPDQDGWPANGDALCPPADEAAHGACLEQSRACPEQSRAMSPRWDVRHGQGRGAATSRGGEGGRDAGAASGCFHPPHADSNEFETVSVSQCLSSTMWAGLGPG